MNTEKIREMIRNKEWKNIGRDKILLLALAGILLIGASYFDGGRKDSTDEEKAVSVPTQNEAIQLTEYQKQMENKIKVLIESVPGISDASVMITFKSGSEKILQGDSEITDSSKKSGADSDSSKTVKKTTVIFNKDGEESPYVVKEIYPEVEGIAVAAKGISSDTGKTGKEEIINMLAALFDVPLHKISVLEIN